MSCDHTREPNQWAFDAAASFRPSHAPKDVMISKAPRMTKTVIGSNAFGCLIHHPQVIDVPITLTDKQATKL